MILFGLHQESQKYIVGGQKSIIGMNNKENKLINRINKYMWKKISKYYTK